MHNRSRLMAQSIHDQDHYLALEEMISRADSNHILREEYRCWGHSQVMMIMGVSHCAIDHAFSIQIRNHWSRHQRIKKAHFPSTLVHVSSAP